MLWQTEEAVFGIRMAAQDDKIRIIVTSVGAAVDMGSFNECQA
jgi:hypothetical protein